jgi:ATP-binding cassette subfamily B protein
MLVGMITVIFSIALPKFKIVQNLIDKLNLVTRENLSGMMVIRAFNRQKFEEARFDKANRELTDTNLFINRVMVVMMPAMTLIMSGLSLLIIWVGSKQVAQRTCKWHMMAFLQYAMPNCDVFLDVVDYVYFLQGLPFPATVCRRFRRPNVD